MRRGSRLPERLYGIAMWGVSAVLAVFLIGLGGLVIDDLPRGTPSIPLHPDYPPALELQRASLKKDRDRRVMEREAQALRLEAARKAMASAKEGFSTWIETRKATTDPTQDRDVLERTRRLEQLQGVVRVEGRRLDEIDAAIEAIARSQRAALAQRKALDDAYRPIRARLVFRAETQVFLLRLAFTLPLLFVSAFLVLRRRNSAFWPLYRGFVLAALYGFFVELVPYLPSYGGYIRYGVGVVMTVMVCIVLVRNMRAYLARRRAAESESEVLRRQRVDRDNAYARIDRKICPDCERPLRFSEGQETNFCVHCGLTLYRHCPVCQTRNLAFNRFCLSCGHEEPGRWAEEQRAEEHDVSSAATTPASPYRYGRDDEKEPVS